MNEQVIASSIMNKGFISAITRFPNKSRKLEKQTSTEEFVGKIAAVFLPYISTNITEGKFISLQAQIAKIVNEIKDEKGF